MIPVISVGMLNTWSTVGVTDLEFWVLISQVKGLSRTDTLVSNTQKIHCRFLKIVAAFGIIDPMTNFFLV